MVWETNYINAVRSGQAGRTAALRSTQTADFRGSLDSALKSGQKTDYDDIFQRASERYGVPVNLLKAVGKAESNFDAGAVSRSGAQGIMQLMPGTAAALGVSDAFDAEQNIMGGAKYLAQKLSQYGGDVKLCLAAYNAGSGNVKKYGGIPPFKETQNYVEKVLRYMGENIIAGDGESSGRAALPVSDSTGAQLLGKIDARDALSAFVRTAGDGSSLGKVIGLDDSEDPGAFLYGGDADDEWQNGFGNMLGGGLGLSNVLLPYTKDDYQSFLMSIVAGNTD